MDFTCQVTAAHVDWEVDAEDPTEVLCGETVPGERAYTSVLAGTLYQDLGDAAGIVAYSWAHKGEEVPFRFIPSTTAGDEVTGTLILDPLSVGGDEAGTNMTSDFEWAIVGEPTLAADVGRGGEAAAPTTRGKAKAGGARRGRGIGPVAKSPVIVRVEGARQLRATPQGRRG